MMVTENVSTPDWLALPPSRFDIVTGYYPETKPEGGALKLRPLLVTKVLKSRVTGKIAVEVAYGTTNLKTWSRSDLDVIVQNSSDLDEMGLAASTRFVLDPGNLVILPWNQENFGCWSDRSSPRRGTLLLTYQKDFAYAMMRRLSVG